MSLIRCIMVLIFGTICCLCVAYTIVSIGSQLKKGKKKNEI